MTLSSLSLSARRKPILCRSLQGLGSDDDLIADRNQRNEGTNLSPPIVLGVMIAMLQDVWLNVLSWLRRQPTQPAARLCSMHGAPPD
jgi:hypothetical protein